MRQDQDISLAVIHKLDKGLDLSRRKSMKEKEGITNQTIFILAAFWRR